MIIMGSKEKFWVLNFACFTKGGSQSKNEKICPNQLLVLSCFISSCLCWKGELLVVSKNWSWLLKLHKPVKTSLTLRFRYFICYSFWWSSHQVNGWSWLKLFHVSECAIWCQTRRAIKVRMVNFSLGLERENRLQATLTQHYCSNCARKRINPETAQESSVAAVNYIVIKCDIVSMCMGKGSNLSQVHKVS